MLKQRILSALVLVPLVILAVLKLGPVPFAVLVGVAVMLAAWEWSGLVPLKNTATRVSYLALTLALLALAWNFARLELMVNTVMWLALALWLFALFWITRPTLGTSVTGSHSAAKAVIGLAVLTSTWLALVVLHSRPDNGPHWVLFILFLVWAADSGAYFAGRQFGRTKLAPVVSPGKTWEGVFGALAVCLLFAFGYAHFIGLRGSVLASFLLVCMVTVMFSIAGDLLESLLKRHHGVKDSGNLIPGHGGMLDRVDSLLAAAPIFLFGLRWIDL